MSNIIDGRMVSLNIKNNIRKEIEESNINPSLTVIQIGDNFASNMYINTKKKACEMVGINFDLVKFNENVGEDEVISEIEKLNKDDEVNAILLQLPLPSGFNTLKIINKISPLKDVDGLTYRNIGMLNSSNPNFIPCTPKGIMELLKEYKVELEGKNVCVIGRSNLVGKPLAQLLLKQNATVTICHSKSTDITKYTKLADVVISAAGCPKLVTKDMIKEGAVVIDVGITRVDKELCGDVDFEEVKEKASLITPVPGGVGPMTIACLLQNVLKAYRAQNVR